MSSIPSVLTGFVPLWALTAVGYLVARSGILGPQAESVLGRFVFQVAMPAALFVMIAKAPLGSFANTSMLAFAVGTLVVSVLGHAAGGRLFRRGPGERAISGMTAGYVNSANLGIPVAVQILGDASFIAQVLLFQVLLVTPVVLTLLDADSPSAGAERPEGAVRRALRMPLRNPVLLASALGVLVSATGLRLPTAVAHPCELLGGAGVPTALVTLGMSLHGRTPAGGSGRRSEVAVAVVLKTLVQPLTALAVGGPVLHLPPHQLLAVVLCSALPTAQNVFVYARQYDLGAALARDAVLFSTLASMATLSLIPWALGVI